MSNGTDTACDSSVPTFRQRQEALKRAYRDDPTAGLQTTKVHSVTGDGNDPSRVRIAVDGQDGTVFEVGAHASVGGDGELPCSGDLFLASLAACQEITIRLVAAALGVRLDRLAVRVEGDWDARGTLAVDREAPVGYGAIRIAIDVDTDADDDQVRRLLKSSRRYCVVSATLDDAPAVAFQATVNGEPG